MLTLLEVVRFFLVVRPWHPMIARCLGAVVVIAGGSLAAGRATAAEALAPVLVLQAFATSSGFLPAAHRGHYDLLFASGCRRTWIAAGHCALSAAPGIAAWLAIALIELVSTRGGTMAALAPRTMAGVAVASTLPWAVTVSLPRLAGGVIWVVAAVVATSVVRIPWLTAVIVTPTSVAHVITAALAMAAALMWIERTDIPLETGQ